MDLESLRRSLSARTAIALAVALVLAVVFLELMGLALEGSAPPLDVAITRWLRAHASPFLDGVMLTFTRIGSYLGVSIMVTIVALWARWRGARALSWEIVAITAAAIILNSLLKNTFERPRPDIVPEAIVLESWSFPSGHSMVSFAAYGTAAFIVGTLRPALKVPAWLFALVVVALVGISRVYRGEHWSTDVAAGFAAAGILLVATRLAIGRIGRRGRVPAP